MKQIAIISLCFVGLAACQPDLQPEVEVASIVTTKHFTTHVDSVQIQHCLDTLLQNTVYAGKTTINMPYDSNALNVYLLNGNSFRITDDPDFKEVVGNCSYIGSNIIMIDVAYVNEFLPKHHVDTVNESPRHLRNQTCFIYWILGHELGHAFNHQPHSHYDSGYLDRFVKSSDIDNVQELQADSFFVSTIIHNEHLRVSVETTLMTILNKEIEEKVGVVKTQGVGIIYDYSNESFLEYTRQPTHPEFVIRLSRMLELSTKKSGEDGLYNLVEGFINHLKERKRGND